MKYGLSKTHLEEIRTILKKFNAVQKAILFGSRAMGNYKQGSDVDIVIKGNKADVTLAAKIKYYFEEETYLPYFFDIISYQSLQSKEMKEHIRLHGKLIYSTE